MAVERRARNIVITDARSVLELRKHIDTRERNISGPVKAMWKRQGELVNVDTVKLALQVGTVPSEWEDPWNRMIREFVRDDVISEWIKSISTAGDGIAKKVNRIQRKQFDFDSTMTTVKSWVDNEGGKLIVNLTAAQIGSVNALLQNQIALGVTSPYILAQRIKPIVGLTQREALAVTRFLSALTEEGISAAAINSQVERYAKYLHNNRAFRIARTEISNSYNFGQLDSVKQARDAGWLPGDPQKEWIAGGSNPCDICLENEGAGAIPVDNTFPSGDESPTAHPSCQCGCGYSIRR